MPLDSRNDLSRGFWFNLEFTRKFTSRDFVFYIKPLRSDYDDYYRCEVIWSDSSGGSSEGDFVWPQEVDR